jgi:hypothetical protein
MKTENLSDVVMTGKYRPIYSYCMILVPVDNGVPRMYFLLKYLTPLSKLTLVSFYLLSFSVITNLQMGTHKIILWLLEVMDYLL